MRMQVQMARADIVVEFDSGWRVGPQYAVCQYQLPDGVARAGVGHEDEAIARVDGEAVGVGSSIDSRDQRLARGSVCSDAID